ncbi:hypothetical protein [Actinophytocola sp.]|uniref:hypothetical protein n=1 Tax=Actinophytocola sp. TaxID=1872138 RepID=UPI002ED7C46A
MGTTRRLVLPGVCLAMALAVLGPLLGRGFVLSYDMVFAPRQTLLPDSLGLGSALPRSVPADAVVAFLTTVVPGDLVQQLLLLAALVVGPLGAGLLVPSDSQTVRVVAAVAYGWSAYVAERLFIGHWPYLLAYACLPWIARAALALRTDPKLKQLAVLVLVTAPAVLTPSGGLLAAGTAIVCGGVRRLPVTIGVSVALNAPWWVPAVLHPGGGLSTPDAVTAFAARGESWGGPLVSLLGLGGIWNSEVTPASRANPLVPVLIIAMVGVAILGMRELHRRWGPGLLVLGVAGLLVAALGGTGLLGWVVAHVPGGGLLRDSQKWVAWWALPFALGFALGVAKAAKAASTAGTNSKAAKGIVIAAAVIPIAMMPDLAWAGWGRLQAVDYPADWAEVRHILATDPRGGDVVTLPFQAFRQFGWNGERTQLDPAPRVLPRTTVIDDTLVVNGRPLAGEDPRAAAIRDGGDLKDLGIGWVLVEHGTPGRVDRAVLDQGHPVHEGEWLDLYRVDGTIAPDPTTKPPRPAVLAADALALVTVTLSLLWLALPAGSLRRSNRRTREL